MKGSENAAGSFTIDACGKARRGTNPNAFRYFGRPKEAWQEDVMGRGLWQEDVMGRGLLLWLLGIPIPIIILIWVLGGLHG
jgi:hypothetical protein